MEYVRLEVPDSEDPLQGFVRKFIDNFPRKVNRTRKESGQRKTEGLVQEYVRSLVRSQSETFNGDSGVISGCRSGLDLTRYLLLDGDL